MNALLDCDFLQLVKQTTKPERSGQSKELMLTEADQCFKSVTRAFELRHIFCHETASSVAVDRSEIEACVKYCQSFLFATGALLSTTLNPDWELNQSQLTEKADNKLREAQDVLRSVENELGKAFGDDDIHKKLLRDAQMKWRDFAKANAALMVRLFEGGSIYPMAQALTLEKTTKQRSSELNEFLDEARSFMEDI